MHACRLSQAKDESTGSYTSFLSFHISCSYAINLPYLFITVKSDYIFENIYQLSDIRKSIHSACLLITLYTLQP